MYQTVAFPAATCVSPGKSFSCAFLFLFIAWCLPETGLAQRYSSETHTLSLEATSSSGLQKFAQFQPAPSRPAPSRPAPSRPAPPGPSVSRGQFYTVKAGDTLFGIARRFNTTSRVLMAANGLTNGGLIYVNQRLLIPASGGNTGGNNSLVNQGGSQNESFDPYAASGLPQAVGRPPLAATSGQGQSSSDQGQSSFDPYAASGITIPGQTANGRTVPPPQIIAPVTRQVPVSPVTGQMPVSPAGSAFPGNQSASRNQPSVLPPASVLPGNQGGVKQRILAPSPLIANPQPADVRKVMHVVRPGDSLATIAALYGVTSGRIVKENRLSIPVQIYVGQALFIPASGFMNRQDKGVASGVLPQTSQVSDNRITGGQIARGERSLTPVTETLRLPALYQDPRLPNPSETVASPPGPVLQAGLVSPQKLPELPLKPGIKPENLIRSQSEALKQAASNEGSRSQPLAPVRQKEKESTQSRPDPVSVLAPRPPERDSRFIWPVRGRLLSSFGTKTDGSINDGIDISVDPGTDVVAADEGVVLHAGRFKGLGNLILLQHKEGWLTAYAHNSELKVKKGDKVGRGEVIALSGQSGNAKQPQLHFEIRQRSRSVDPLNYLASSN